MELTQEQYGTVLQIAKVASYKYAKRCWWADAADLEQQAVVEMLGSAHNWDPDYGVRFGAYMWRVAVLSLRNYLLKQSSPVSATNQGTELANLKGILHTPYMRRVMDGGEHERCSVPPSQYKCLRSREIASTIRARVEELVGEDADIAIKVLSREYKPREIAQMQGIPESHVRVKVQNARAKMFDTELHAMWRGADL